MGLKPELLELEITENLLLTYFPHIMSVFKRLKGVGVKLALDDFGAGYSSLAQVRQLPVDTLKIDRSIIDKIPGSKVDRAMVDAITVIGRALGMAVIAEGVETAEQFAYLRGTSCDLLQGFYFSMPLPPERAAALIGKKSPPQYS
ncbi:MAG: EAL domain-containing protein [Dethiobacteria bacterium]